MAKKLTDNKDEFDFSDIIETPNKREEFDFTDIVEPEKKNGAPNFPTSIKEATSTVQTPLAKPSPLVSNLKSTSVATKPKQVNPFTAPIEEIKNQYGENYNKEQQLTRQKNYTQGLEKLSKRVETLIPQYEAQVAELGQLDAELENLKQDPNAYNQAIQVRNQKVGDIIKLADSLRAEKEKADIYEKGLSAVDVLRRANEDTFENRTQSALNTLGIMSTTMLPTIARGAKLVDSYVQAKVMGLDDQETELYTRAQSEISKKNWKGLTDVAREFYDKNQILEGGFSKESGFEKIKEGDYKAAGTLLAKELVQNLPITLGIGLSFANPLLGAAFTIGGTAGAELQDMDINNTQMSEQAKIANAFVKGGSEYVTEKIFGTFNYLGRIAGGSVKTEAGKKMLMGSIKEAYEQVAKRFGLGADVIEEVSTEMLNKLVGDYADYKSGKTSELDFKKGLGETITTALSTSLLLGGAGRAAKYGSKKIDELRAKARQLETTLQDPSIKPEIANAIKEEVLNVNQQIGDEAAKAKATYDALPEEQQNKVDALVEEKTATEQLLQDPQLPQEIKPSVEEKLNTIQSEIDNEYKNVDKKLIPTEESKLEAIINEPINQAETNITPSSSLGSEVSAPSSIEPLINTENAVQIRSTEKEVSRNGETRKNQPESSEGVRPSEQGQEPTKQGEEKAEPPVVEQTTTDVGGVKTPSVSNTVGKYSNAELDDFVKNSKFKVNPSNTHTYFNIDDKQQIRITKNNKTGIGKAYYITLHEKNDDGISYNSKSILSQRADSLKEAKKEAAKIYFNETRKEVSSDMNISDKQNDYSKIPTDELNKLGEKTNNFSEMAAIKKELDSRKPKTNETEKTEVSKAEPSSKTKSPTSSKGKEKVNPTTQKAVEQILNKEVNNKGELPNSNTTRKNKRETALKEVAESLDAKEKVAVEHIVKNLDLIREKLLNEGLIKTDCSWSAK